MTGFQNGRGWEARRARRLRGGVSARRHRLQSELCRAFILPTPSARRSARFAISRPGCFRASWKRAIWARCKRRSGGTCGSGGPKPFTGAAARPAISNPATCGEVLDLIPGRPWLEATIEAAPGGLTAARAHAWAECGINRVSLGVQSFVEKEIRRAGRKHTAQTVADELRLLESAGIRNCNIDLIAGLAGQTEGELARIARLDRAPGPAARFRLHAGSG